MKPPTCKRWIQKRETIVRSMGDKALRNPHQARSACFPLQRQLSERHAGLVDTGTSLRWSDNTLLGMAQNYVHEVERFGTLYLQCFSLPRDTSKRSATNWIITPSAWMPANEFDRESIRRLDITLRPTSQLPTSLAPCPLRCAFHTVTILI